MSEELNLNQQILNDAVVPEGLPPQTTDASEIIELDGDFNYDGYQVVRREFFAHTFEPSITFNNYKVYVNAACLNKLSNVEYVQLLVNSETKIMALRPCEEEVRDSFAWCNTGSGKRKPKQITCRLFFAKIFTLMNWNPDYRYKLLGKVVRANGQYLIVFDMSATEVYQRTFPEGKKPRTSRVPVFPAEWQDQFGMPFEEHRKSLQINIFNGYAVYAIKENQKNEGAQQTIENAVTPENTAQEGDANSTWQQI